GMEPGAFAARVLGDGGRGYREADLTGGDVAIPAEKFLAQAPALSRLLDDAKASADGLSPREARAEQERLAARTAELASFSGDPAASGARPEPLKTAVADAEGASPDAIVGRMTLEERGAYHTASATARGAAEQELVRRVTEGGRRENAAWFRSEKARIEAEVRAELDADPAQRALLFLQKGEVRGAPDVQAAAALLRDEQGRPLKLDRAELVDRFGQEAVEKLPRGIFGGKRGESAPLEDVATLLGFRSGVELVDALRTVQPRGAFVPEEVQRRLDETYGPALLDSPHDLATAALEAVHSEAAAAKVLLEIHSLRRQLDPSARPAARVPELPAITATVERILREKPIAEISPAYYLQAERAAARRAIDFATAGKIHKALLEKETQLLNQVLYREAVALRARMDVELGKIERGASDGTVARLGKADPILRDAHEAILEAIGVRRWDPRNAGRPGVDALVAKLERDASPPAFDVDQLRDVVARRRSWRSLTPGEAENVADAVAQIKASARNATELDLEGRKVDRDFIIAELEERAAKLPPQKKAPRDDARGTAARRASLFLQWGDSVLLSPETRIHLLDGGEKGPFHEAIWNPYLRAKYRKHDLEREYLSALMKHWEEMPAEMKARRFDT
ncbi:MAG: hypothetical protein WB493_03450, partial [Anaeromyxobacteraceae bacterium]